MNSSASASGTRTSTACSGRRRGCASVRSRSTTRSMRWISRPTMRPNSATNCGSLDRRGSSCVKVLNPLVAIKTFTQLLPRRSSEPQFVAEFGRIVGREIHRMERVVDRLRTLAHPRRRPEHAVDVRVPLAEALEFMQATFDEKRIVVGASLGETPCRVLGDHQNLEQLFLNLLMNAHEATPPGGSLSVGVTREAEQATVTVADTGPGIAPELLEKIFEPFFTTKQRGSGLGLAISAGVAQAHGARLHAANRPDGGATFTVEFPLAPVTAPVVA